MGSPQKRKGALRSLAGWMRDAASRDGLILPEADEAEWSKALADPHPALADYFDEGDGREGSSTRTMTPRRSRSVSDAAAPLGLEDLLLRARNRFPTQLEQPDLLPDPAELDIEAAMVTPVRFSEHRPAVTRRSLSDQVALLRWQFRDRPEILFWHALAISYLRRQTEHTEKARALFFRIWDEKADWMADTLNGRWLISALQTFADHGRTHGEILGGSIGFMYGNFVKIYEAEIVSAYDRKTDVGKFRSGGVQGLFAFQPGDDILLNINTFVMASVENSGPAALPLLKLLALTKDGASIFSRTDEIAKKGGEGYLSFDGAMK
jgi:hypothetical protein